jgi:hypothetical protein
VEDDVPGIIGQALLTGTYMLGTDLTVRWCRLTVK